MHHAITKHAVITTNNIQPKRYQCRHIFTDGHRCGSPCLRGEELCYYHHTTRKPVTGARRRRSRRSAFDLPLPEDRSAIQSSIGQVLQRIASNDLDSRRAGLLLYGLQIASLNLPREASPAPAADTVEELILDPALGPLAPRAEAGQTNSRRSPVAALLEQLAIGEEDEEALQSILPAVQASAELQPVPSNHRTLTSRAMPHQRKRSQILVLLPMSKGIQPAVPGNLLELLSRLQRRQAKLRRRLRRKPGRRVLHKRNQSLHTKVSPSMPRLHHALGHQQQLRSRLKRLHRRLMRQVRKQTQRHRRARQNSRTLRIMKHSRQPTRVHIGKNAKRKIVATQKRRRKANPLRSPDQLMVHRLCQLSRSIHHVRARRPQQLRSAPAKDPLNLGRNRLRRLLGPGNIGQQKDHMRAQVHRIEEVSTRPHRVILRVQINTLQPLELHSPGTSARRCQIRFRRLHRISTQLNVSAIVTPRVTHSPTRKSCHFTVHPKSCHFDKHEQRSVLSNLEQRSVLSI